MFIHRLRVGPLFFCATLYASDATYCVVCWKRLQTLKPVTQASLDVFATVRVTSAFRRKTFVMESFIVSINRMKTTVLGVSSVIVMYLYGVTVWLIAKINRI